MSDVNLITLNLELLDITDINRYKLVLNECLLWGGGRGPTPKIDFFNGFWMLGNKSYQLVLTASKMLFLAKVMTFVSWACTYIYILQFVREFKYCLLKIDLQKYTSPKFFIEFAKNVAGILGTN